MNIEDKKLFSDRLRELIHTLRILDMDFAKAGGITKQTLSGYLKGEREPSYTKLVNWVRAYRVNPTWLLTGQGDMFQNESSTATEIDPGLPGEKTPLEREMETFTRLMKQCGAPEKEIRQGLLAKMGVKNDQQKNMEGYGVREISGPTSASQINEPNADFGKGI